MKKLLKILFAIEFILILAIIILALIGNKQAMPTAYAVKENPIEEIRFKVLTKAVCEETHENQGRRESLILGLPETESRQFSGHRKSEGFSRELEHVFCHDELFVKCNDKEYLVSNESLGELAECNGIKINLSGIEANGNTEFKNEWIDPRNNS